MWEQVGSGLPSPFPSPAPAPAAAQNTASICQSRSEPSNECTEGDTLAGSCQSPGSNGISKFQTLASLPRGQPCVAGGHSTGGHNKGRQKAALAGGHRGSVERGGGRAGGCRAPPPRQHAALGDKAAELLGPGSTVTLE